MAGRWAYKVLRKIIIRAFVFYIIVSITFIIPRLLPGGAFAYLAENPNISPELREALIKEFKLDQPLWEQYKTFVKEFFLHGNLGISFSRLEPVSKVIKEALPWTIVLVTTSIIASALIGIFLGAIAAYRRGSLADSFLVSLVMFIRSMPSFWLGIVLLIIFGYYFGLAPLYGAYSYGTEYTSRLEFLKDVIYHLWLPFVTLVVLGFAGYFMLMRNTMLDVLGEEFILAAKAKGMPDRIILFKHALRPASLPVVTALALDLGWSVSGAMLIEVVFSLPGVGKLLYDAVYMTDYPLLLGIVVYTSLLTLVLVTIVEFMYPIIDPRVSAQ